MVPGMPLGAPRRQRGRADIPYRATARVAILGRPLGSRAARDRAPGAGRYPTRCPSMSPTVPSRWSATSCARSGGGRSMPCATPVVARRTPWRLAIVLVGWRCLHRVAACAVRRATSAAPAAHPPSAPGPAPRVARNLQIPDVVAGKFNVAMVLIGPHDDGGWSQAHYEGLQYVCENMPDVAHRLHRERPRRRRLRAGLPEPRRARASTSSSARPSATWTRWRPWPRSSRTSPSST